jgi:decaprenylphospho-beta-D-erythro-pentofuranosid-2-ulose 2-reductase
MNRVMIIGATSAIAQATARLFAQRGDFLVLAGRNEERLQVVAADLEVRGASGTEVILFDAAAETTDYAALARHAWGEGLSLLLLAHGSLPDQLAVQDDPDASLREMQVNALSGIAVLAAFAPLFEQQASGTIVAISSVAGDRGRQSNYVYGAAKAALSTYSQGLRNRLSKSGVAVLTVKPGFVDTPMTAGFNKGLLWAQPDSIARGILSASEGAGGVIYLPWFWRYIMLVIKLIPERLFKKLSL